MGLLRLLPILVALSSCSDGSPSRRDGSNDGPRPDLLRPDSAPVADGRLPDGSTGPWVKILKPASGATLQNPVTFTVTAQDVATVRLFADAWPLGPAWDPAASDQLTYTFNGVGYARQIELFGYDVQGSQLATDAIQITVSSASTDKGQLVGQMWNTYYYLATESGYGGVADTTLYDAQCAPIVKVSAAFSDSVCIEGSGKLNDGRVINFAKTCSCGRPCPTGGIICYSVLDKTKYPWGMGAASNALVPLRSWAVDKSQIPLGTILYAEQWDGVAVPKVDGLGGFTHDGCFRADDVGGAISGLHYDYFAATKGIWQALEKIHKTKSSFTVYKNPGRCAHLQSP